MRICFLGVKGSGKGTYASRLAPILKVPHISTGDIFRDNIKKGTELGKQVEHILKEGRFVPDEITLEIIKERLDESDCKNGFILDGFPRTLEQAKGLDEIEKIDVVIYLNVPEEVIVRRIATRITCRECGTIYNTDHIKPKVEGVCDKCEGELYQRHDDSPEAARKRIEHDEKNMQPLLDYYQGKGILKTVTCERADILPDEMVERIRKVLGV